MTPPDFRTPCITPGCPNMHRSRSKAGGRCGHCRLEAIAARGTRQWVDCACGCGTRFLPDVYGTKYFNEAHRDDHYKRLRRAARRKGKTTRHPNTILIWQLRDEMDAEGKAGLCIYCETRLPPLKTHVCGSKECANLYNTDWKRGRTMNERLAREAKQVDPKAAAA